MIKILRDKKGMTLVELLVGMTLFAIIATIVSAILVPMLNIYKKSNELSECNTLLDNIANQMIDDLSEATALLDLKTPEVISITKDTSNDMIYAIDSDGVVTRNDIPVLSKIYYKNRSVSFSCELAEGMSEDDTSKKVYILTVIIKTDEGDKIIQRDYAVKPLVLNQKPTWQ